MLDKFKIKQFVHSVIGLVWGLQGKLARLYGKSSFWISDILDEKSETDGFVYGFLLFMERVNEESPETFAMINDEVRRILDEMRTGETRSSGESVDVLLNEVSKAYIQFLTAYRTRQGKGQLKTQAANLNTHVRNLLQAIDPSELIPVGGSEKVRNFR